MCGCAKPTNIWILQAQQIGCGDDGVKITTSFDRGQKLAVIDQNLTCAQCLPERQTSNLLLDFRDDSLVDEPLSLDLDKSQPVNPESTSMK